MTVEIQCRECGGVLRAKDDSIGQTLPCPKCGHPLVVEGIRTAARSRGAGGALPIVLALIALAVAIFAACWAYFRDPIGRGLSAYDFSTPEAAMRSEMQLRLNRDIRAQIELDSLRNSKRNQEFLDSVKVHKTSDYDRSGEPGISQDKEYDRVWKVVFLTYRVDGKEQHSYRFYRRHKDSGLWMQGFASVFNIKGDLRKEIDDWNRQFAAANRGRFARPPVGGKAPPLHGK